MVILSKLGKGFCQGSLVIIFCLLSTKAQAEDTSPKILSQAPFPLTAACTAHIEKVKSAGYEYGWVEAPAFPILTNIRHKIYVFAAYKLTPEHPLIVIYNGGPASSSHSTFSYFQSQSELKGSYLFLDQRGTGCSSVYPDFQDELQVLYIWWGTSGIVHDSEAWRKSLGLSRWDVWGQSYGSLIVQRYLQLFPGSILRAGGHGAAVANVKPGGVDRTSLTPYFDLRYRYQIQVLKAYLEKHPEVRKKLIEINQQGPLCNKETLQCLPELLVTSKSLIGFASSWPDFAQQVDFWHKISTDPLFLETHGSTYSLEGKIKLLREQGAQKQASSPSGSTQSKPQRRYSELGFMLTLEYSGEAYTLIHHPTYLRLGLRELGHVSLLPLLESFDLNKRLGEQDSQLRESQLAYSQLALSAVGVNRIETRKIRQNLEAHPDIEYTLWAGEFDPYSPVPMLALSAAQIGPRCKFVKLKGTAHDFLSPEIVDFLNQKRK